jgi:putative glutamine amidotransferase
MGFLKSLILIFAMLSWFPQGAWAGAVELLLWQPTPEHTAFVIAKRETETPAQAVERYQSSFNQDPDLVSVMGKQLNLPLGQVFQISDLNSGKGSDSVLTALMANASFDYEPDSWRIKNFKKPLEASGAKVIAIPIAPMVGLSPAEAAEFRAQLTSVIDMAIFMGGDDLDPEVFGRENRHSTRIHPSRDKEERALVRAFYAGGRTFLAGICRGHQMIVSSLDKTAELVQDLGIEHGLPSHMKVMHPLLVRPTGTSMDQAFRALPSGSMAYSLHHQGFMDLSEKSPFEVIARDEHGVVEATALKSGRGFTVQYHPEKMDWSVSIAFFGALVTETQRYQSKFKFDSSPRRPMRRPVQRMCVDLFAS